MRRLLCFAIVCILDSPEPLTSRRLLHQSVAIVLRYSLPAWEFSRVSLPLQRTETLSPWTLNHTMHGLFQTRCRHRISTTLDVSRCISLQDGMNVGVAPQQSCAYTSRDKFSLLEGVDWRRRDLCEMALSIPPHVADRKQRTTAQLVPHRCLGRDWRHEFDVAQNYFCVRP